MKTRTKPESRTKQESEPPVALSGRASLPRGSVHFLDVPQAGMVVLRENDGERLDVEGAYVKVSPTVRTSERFTIDQKLVRTRLLDAGAVAVIVAPVVLPDGVENREQLPPAVIRTPEEHLRSWFAGVKAEKGMVEMALNEALQSVRAAGL
jgi:hypothetical protein